MFGLHLRCIKHRIAHDEDMRNSLRWVPLSADEGAVAETTESEFDVSSETKFLCLSVRGWCLVSSVIHLMLGLAALALYFAEDMGAFSLTRLKTPVSQTINLRRTVGSVGLSWQGSDLGDGVALKGACSLLEKWNETSAESHFTKPLVISYGTVDMRMMMFIIYLVAGFFLFFSGLWSESYYETLAEGDTHVYHFVEGSFTAPIVVLLVCARSGVTDLMVLLGSACCMWSCMIFGQLAALLYDDTSTGTMKYGRVGIFTYYAVSHFAYWISFTCSVAMFSSGISAYSTCVSKLPSDVYSVMGIVTAYLMVILFAMFGLVQTYVLFNKPRKTEYMDAVANSEDGDPRPQKLKRMRALVSAHAELVYILIGLFTKLLLGLLLFTGSLP